jgi:hypothetical protein
MLFVKKRKKRKKKKKRASFEFERPMRVIVEEK